MTSASAPPPTTAPRDRSLSVQLLVVLALGLLPLGILATLLAIRNYQGVIRERAAQVAAIHAMVKDDHDDCIELRQTNCVDVPQLPSAPPPLTAQQFIGIALPPVLWIAGLGIGWIATRRLVVAPLWRLQHLVETSDHVSNVAQRLADGGGLGSREMTALATSVLDMAAEIASRSRDLDTALAEQRRLTREVHHRVKNSLQIISSLLSLHARGQSTPDVAQTYASIQARVSALTMVHRWIYDEEGAAGVNLRALVADLASALESSLASPRHPHVSIGRGKVAAVTICADVAVPVAFLITELTSIAVQQGEAGRVQIRIAASRSCGDVTIAVEAPAFTDVDWLAAHAASPSSRIVQGMARQLRSQLQHDPERGCYTVTFADRQG